MTISTPDYPCLGCVFIDLALLGMFRMQMFSFSPRILAINCPSLKGYLLILGLKITHKGVHGPLLSHQMHILEHIYQLHKFNLITLTFISSCPIFTPTQVTNMFMHMTTYFSISIINWKMFINWVMGLILRPGCRIAGSVRSGTAHAVSVISL